MTNYPESSNSLDLKQYTIDHVLDGIYWCDEQARILDVNDSACKMVGYSRKELTSMTVAQLDPNISIEKWPEHWTILKKQGSVTFETIHQHKDGHVITVEITANFIIHNGQELHCDFVRDITERKRIQSEATALLQRHQTLMKYANDGIHILDMHGNIVEANDSFCRMLGYTQEEVARLSVADWDKNWSAEELRERIKQLIQDGFFSTFETKHCRKDGTLIDVEISVSAVEIKGKHYVFASSRDITSRKLAEDMLRVAAATFETHEPIMITDAHANIIRVNQAFQDVTGYSSEEVLGKNPRILSSNRQDKPFYEAMWKQLLDTGSWTGEIWDRRKNGQIYPKLLTITAVKNDHREITQYVGIFRDITERKKIEEEMLLKSGTVQRHADELTQELGYLLKNSFNEIYIFDADSLRLLLTSEGAEKNLGYSPDELKQFTPLDLCPSITAESFNQMLALLSSGQQASLFFETVHHRKNQTTYPVEGRLQFINLDNPVFMAIVQDITEHRAAESRLRNLSTHLLTVREEEKASIAREIHDDLGGTLTALKMDINWLMDEMVMNKEASALLNHVESMSKLLDDAAVVTRRVITDLRPTILDDLGLCAALEWQAREFHKRSGIQCLVTCRSEGCKRLDKMQTIHLFRIFQESLTNVARHSGASRVEAKLHYEDEKVILTISDNGYGLPEGGPIAQTSYGILGMRERVEQMEGTIDFYNLPGGGFSVTVILPLRTDNQKEGTT